MGKINPFSYFQPIAMPLLCLPIFIQLHLCHPPPSFQAWHWQSANSGWVFKSLLNGKFYDSLWQHIWQCNALTVTLLLYPGLGLAPWRHCMVVAKHRAA